MSKAQERARNGLQQTTSRFFGSDSDRRVIEIARSNARHANVAELITFNVSGVSKLTNPLPEGPIDSVVSNPPYGEASGQRAGADCVAQYARAHHEKCLWRLATVSVQRLTGVIELPATTRKAPVQG